MNESLFVILVTSITGIITTVLGFAYNLYRDNRNRRWDLENRRLAREEIVARLDENTDLSRVAFKEANDVNMKIAKLTQQFYEALPARVDGEPTVAVIKRVDENTKEAVNLLRKEDHEITHG